MLERELTYQMPFERLVKLSRSASRKAFATSWRALLALIVAYIAGLAALIVFAPVVKRWLTAAGLPGGSDIAILMVAFFGGIYLLRRLSLRQVRERGDFNSLVRFKEDQDGLRFATPHIEYYLKWDGISQMLLEPDGVAISHVSLFFLIPDSAFIDRNERDTLIRDVFARLSETARARSERFLRPVLGSG